MKRLIVLFCLALSVLAISCQKETIIISEQNTHKRIVGISLESDAMTRTSLDNLSIVWSEGDVIKIVSTETGSAEDVTVPAAYVGKKYCSLETSISGEIAVVYPADAYDEKTGMINLPSAQNYYSGSFANNLSVLYGVTETDELALTAAQSFIKISSDENIRAIIMEAIGGETVSGYFELDCTNGLTPFSGSSSIYLSDIPDNTKEVILAVPGGEYAKGFKFFIKGTGDAYHEANAYTAGKTLSQAHLITMPELTISSLPATAYDVIATADDLKNFLANAASKTSDYVAMIVNDIDCASETLTPAASFSGKLKGSSHIIKKAKISTLFETLNEGSVVQDIVIDESVVANPSPVFGFICKENSGTVKGCVNNADIALENVDASARFGAIVGACANTGRVSGCTNNGDISISGTVTKLSYFGGVVGCLTFDPVLGDDVLVAGCINNGDVNVEASSAGSIFIGGVLGGNSAHKVTAAVNIGNVENCINKGSVKYYLGTLTSGTYSNVGGVIGYFEGDVAGLRNYGRVENSTIEGDGSANATCPSAAGVVANLIYGAKDCENYGEIVANGIWAAGTANNTGVGGCKQPAFAGVIAKHGTDYTTTATTDTPVTNCTNYGKISGKILMKTGGSVVSLAGGVVATTNCSVSNLKNYGEFDIVLGDKNNYVGGVTGFYSGKSIADCANYGNLTISGHSGLSGSAVLSGIVGCANKQSTIANCINVGKLTFNDIQSSSTSYQYLAGIMGNYEDNGQIIKNCENKGTLTSKCTRKMRIGGIVGAIYDATTAIPTSAGDGGTPGQNNMTGCTNSGNIIVEGAGNPASTFPGSIVGGLAAFGSIGYTDCKNTGNITLSDCADNTAAGLFVGAANRCYNVSGCIIDGKLESNVAANTLGFFSGVPYTKDGQFAVRYYIGQEGAPVTIAGNAKINDNGFNPGGDVVNQICGGGADCTYKSQQFVIKNVKTSN